MKKAVKASRMRRKSQVRKYKMLIGATSGCDDKILLITVEAFIRNLNPEPSIVLPHFACFNIHSYTQIFLFPVDFFRKTAEITTNERKCEENNFQKDS